MKSVTNAIVYGEEHRNRNRAAGLCLGLGNMGVMDCGLVNMGVMRSVIGERRDECAWCAKNKYK